MENIIFERDYAEERNKRREEMQATQHTGIFDFVVNSGFLNSVSKAFAALPREVNPEKKAAYDRILVDLDKMAYLLGGKIKGIVDYTNWQADIYLTMRFAEFSSLEEMVLLKDIAEHAQTLTFSADEQGNIRMHVMIAYFDAIGGYTDTLEEQIQQYPELVQMLDEAERAEKQRIMEDPKVADFIRLGASQSGLPEDEYLDFILKIFRDPPDELISGIQDILEARSKK